MHGLLDEFLVGGALLASIIYALYSLGPRRLRRGLLLVAGTLLRLLPARLGLQRFALRLEAAAAVKTAGACGGCDNCATENPPAAGSGGSAGPSGPAGSEIRIPVSKIGNR